LVFICNLYPSENFDRNDRVQLINAAELFDTFWPKAT
jgi:hypothetical protein